MPFRRYRRRRRRPTRRWRHRRWRRYFRYWHRRPTRRRRHYKWGGHGTERFKTDIGDPSTIPCPFQQGDTSFTGIQDPSKVHTTVLNPWDYDCDGIVRTDTLKKLLELPTETEEEERAYPLLGPKIERRPLSEDDDESVISSTSSCTSEEEEKKKRHKQQPSKRRLLKHLQRVVKRMKTI
uniref:ORF1/1 n=1 Tax=Torque teno sus virus 1b TaxID=687387 RepID=E2IVL8_9VIRU|nr:ORF1/1 [Torque teno sus virus 1b]